MNKQWRQNLRATWIAELLAIMGFASVSPILPYYIQHLGISGDDTAKWAGIVTAATPLMMGFAGPIWGALSDRLGRKLMVVRAMFAGAILTGLMGIACNVQQLTLLRMLQGVLTGTVTAATTLVASSTPRERLGEVLGKLQLAIFLGQSLGPITGGFASDHLGYRAVFWMCGAYLFIAGILVLVLVRENFTPVERSSEGSLWERLQQNFTLLFSGSLLGLVLGIRFSMRVGLRMSTPILPLLIQEIIPPGSLVGSASGFLTTISGISSAVAAPTLGRLADRHGGRGLLLGCTLLSAASLSLQALAPAYWLLVLWQVGVGLAIGGSLAIISAYLGRLAPEGLDGTVYGLDAMAVSLANSVGPLVGGWVGSGVSLQASFFLGSFVTGLAVLIVLRLPKQVGMKAEAT